MNTLQSKLQGVLSNLAKEKNNQTKELLKVVIAELSRYPSKEVPDEEVLRIIKKMKANAIECGNLHEVAILDHYLPQMMSEDELKIYIKNIIDNFGFGVKDMGKVMQYLKQDEKASVIDNKIASKIVKELLSK